jgi:hypothetical protein
MEKSIFCDHFNHRFTPLAALLYDEIVRLYHELGHPFMAMHAAHTFQRIVDIAFTRLTSRENLLIFGKMEPFSFLYIPPSRKSQDDKSPVNDSIKRNWTKSSTMYERALLLIEDGYVKLAQLLVFITDQHLESHLLRVSLTLRTCALIWRPTTFL